MTSANDITTVRLPHTGLSVPNTTLTVTAYKEMTMDCGLAYTANLNHTAGRRQKVGVIENGGNGGPTSFWAVDWRAFGETHLDEYAAQCRTQEGRPVSTEYLLEMLIEEADWVLKLGRAAKNRATVLRLMGGASDGFPPYAVGDWSCGPLRSPAQWAELAERLVVGKSKPRDGQWWQAHTENGWCDVTARPQDFNIDLYH